RHADADDHAGKPHRLPAEVHVGLRRSVRAAAGHHAARPDGRGHQQAAREEPEIRDPRRLHRGRNPHPHSRRLQPDADGGTADSPVRGRHHLRACLRPPAGAGRPRFRGHRRGVGVSTLDLPTLVMEGIRDVGFVTATPIQEAALPLALRGKDVAGQSQTGTGKTAAFLIAAFTRLLREAEPRPGHGSEPRLLIIAPTRELVVKMESDAGRPGAPTPFRILAVYGGIDYNRQREALAAGCDVLVGTPGRLIDYLKQHIWSPRRVEVLVIDEADRMFD